MPDAICDLKVVNLPIDQIKPYEKNPRIHSKEQIQKLANSIKDYGFNEPIAINSNNVVIAGHGRLQAAYLLGLTEVPTIALGHLTRAQQRAYLQAHNRIAQDAAWSTTLLAEEMRDLQDECYDLLKTGFTQDEIDAFLNPEIIFEGHGNGDAVPALADNPVTVEGDVWLLGEHRLKCGDSTNPLHVQELYKEFNPILMVTDPPYGVNYEPEWRDDAGLGVGERATGKVANDDREDWTAAYSLFTGDAVYVWHAGLFSGDIASHLKACDFNLVSQIIWVKQHFAISRGDYHWQHEPCWYAVRKGKKHNWQGSRKEATVWEIDNNGIGSQEREQTWGHGTQKPLECMARPIQNNTKPNDHVYDPFGGSGTTLIACEKYGRKCLMMEILPKYCDIIIKRWQDFTGKKAILEANNLSFEELSHEREGRKANVSA